jgi:HlyD family secretion protein
MKAVHKIRISVVLAVVAGAVLVAHAELGRVEKPAENIPTAEVKQGDLDLEVHTTADLSATQTVMMLAPPVGGGTLQITHLDHTGTRVKKGDIVIAFDPSEQEFNLEQSRSDVADANEEIAKAKADAAVQTAQDQVDLLKAQFAVKQAELDVSKNELLSAIDGKKNLLTLDEAQRALAQLEQDIKSHAASGQASLAVAQEKRNKAQLSMQQARKNIENMQMQSPINGLVEVRGNWAAVGGFFFTGMTLPDFQEGDQVRPGNVIAQILDTDEMELQGQVGEADRAMLKPGQTAEIRIDALPGEVLAGKVKSVAGSAGGSFFDDNQHKFGITLVLDKSDPRVRPGFTAHVTILCGHVQNALYLPSQAVFDKNGGFVVYVKSGNGFQEKSVKILDRTESRVAIQGLNVGTAVALLNPQDQAAKAKGPAGPITPGGAP